MHITVFTSFFVSVSYLVYSPSHRFIRIFNSALSSELSILAIYYFSAPILSKVFHKRIKITNDHPYPKRLKIKMGLKTVSIHTQTIETISTDKPYTIIAINGKVYLDNRTMKDFESILDPRMFFRVHRSVILNKNLVKELKSRKNGDYDAFLFNGKTIRLSRHYRSRWEELLQ
ncbi:MAG: LytR/AlgR family response regulator transcription factor [Flavobacteriaceae bacterium]